MGVRRVSGQHEDEAVEPDMRFVPHPRLAEIVHYVSYGTPGGEFDSQCRAAVVTEAMRGSTTVSVAVLNPSGLFFDQGLPYSHEPRGGTWHRNGECG